MIQPRHTSALAMVALMGGAMLFSSCIKENEKAAEDDGLYYDYNVSKDIIWFDRETDGGNHDIFSVRPGGNANEPIDNSIYINRTNTPNIDERYPAVSHNYKRLAFVEDDVLAHSDLAGNDRVWMPHGAFVAGTFKASYPAWSWRSNYLTFNDRSPDPRVYFAFSDYNQETPEAFTQGFKMPTLEDEFIGFASFYGEENRICYARRDADNFYIETATAKGFDTDAEAPQTVFTSDIGIAWPRVSLDGEMVVFARETIGGSEICVIDIDGENLRVLTSLEADHESPAFSPDGTQVVYSSNEDGQDDLYIVNIDGTGKSNITNTPNLDEKHPFWK